MCGIVGCALRRRASDIIYGGLKQLEYRGYDSAGIATLSKGQISIVKKQGKVSALENCASDLDGNIGIGHTRWATHGKPSDANAHPFAAGKFAIVHNGIIENCLELKREFLSDSPFSSDTDSEVIVRLLDKYYDGNLLTTLKKVCSLLSGSYAIAVICADFEGIAAAKFKSPIIVGSGADGNFAASDAPALAGLCRDISVLEDNDFALITSDGIKIFDGDLNEVFRPVRPNLATPANLELGGCPFYMLKEIREAPYAVANTCAVFHTAEGEVKKLCKNINRIILTGCGTAYNSGLVAKRYIEQFARIPCEAEIAGEFRYKNPIVGGNTLVVAISQSGETADTVEAARLAKSANAKVIAVTNAPYSQLNSVADVVIPVAAGPEICVAATKSYAGQIAALYLLAGVLAGKDLTDDLQKISEPCKNTVENTDISAVADMCARSSGVYFLGRDIDYAVALEGSLKLKEVSYIPSEGYPAGELKHGTLALIDESAVAVVVITSERLAGKSKNAVEQVLSRKGKVAVITCINSIAEEFKDRAVIIKIPDCGEYLSPLVSSSALQLIAYETALLLNRDPDKPRNLAKSVTVE
ncbi:MAG: glutamine--fructose-6-phosphate transaminase (isomerizing) [Clostridia bacterium]|nr:glutamine--fructose-6-phosphate transaminase (isomerizing) [Clostridia bacterium]